MGPPKSVWTSRPITSSAGSRIEMSRASHSCSRDSRSRAARADLTQLIVAADLPQVNLVRHGSEFTSLDNSASRADGARADAAP